MDPYKELRLHANSKHPQKAKLNIVLQAICEIIHDRKGSAEVAIQPVEYFAALMTSLESQDQSHIPQIIVLLSMILPHVNVSVLRLKFSAIAKCFVQLIEHSELDTTTLKSILNCLIWLLKSQEPSKETFSNTEVLKYVHLLISYLTDSRPKIRKTAQQGISDILHFHLESKCDALALHLAQFTENVLKSCTASDETKTLQLLGFLKVILPYLPSAIICRLCPALFNLFKLQKKTLTLVTMQALMTVVEPETCAEYSPVYLEMMCRALVELDIGVHDGELSMCYLHLITSTWKRMLAMNPAPIQSNPVRHALFLRTFMTMCSYFKAKKENIQSGTAKKCHQLVSLYLNLDTLAQLDDQESLSPMITSIESLLALRHQDAWVSILSFIAQVFRHFQQYASKYLTSVLKLVVDVFESTKSLPASTVFALEPCFLDTVGAAIESFGSMEFLSVVPLSSGESLEITREWLLPTCRDHLKVYDGRRKNHLQTFSSTILNTARWYETQLSSESSDFQQKQTRTKIIQLWSLFPSFCIQPVDFAPSFPSLAKLLANALADARYPELQTFVGLGLQALVQSMDTPEERAVMTKYASRYFPILLTSLERLDYEKEFTEQGLVIIETMEALSSVAEPQMLSALFKKLVQKLLEASSDPTLAPIAHLHMSAALAFLKVLGPESVALLYRVVKPYLVQDQDGMMQKRAYAVLSGICQHHAAFTLQLEILEDLVQTLCDSLVTCSIPAKKMRLRCLRFIFTSMVEEEEGAGQVVEVRPSFVPSLVGEIILCTKEANGKAREAAFEVLIAMAKYMQHHDAENGLMNFFQMVLGGLAGQTPHMRSASVLAMSRLIFEFGRKHAHVCDMMPEYLRTILLLLHEKAREVVKAVIGFVKLGIAIIPLETLETMLPDLLEGLLKWVGQSKNRFRAKTKIILMKLCRKYGYEKIHALVPEEDQKLITYLKKEKIKTERKKEKSKEEAFYAKSFDGFMNDDDEDDHEDDESHEPEAEQTPAQKINRKSNAKSAAVGNNKKWIQENAEDEIMDFLDKGAIKNIVSHHDPSKHLSSNDGPEAMEVSNDGRLIIHDDVILKKKKTSSNPLDRDDDVDSEEEEGETMRNDIAKEMQKIGFEKFDNNPKSKDRQHQLQQQGNKKRKQERDLESGREYRSKKAGGDVKKKGQLEPFAYIPLNPKLMAKRNKRQHVEKYQKTIRKARK